MDVSLMEDERQAIKQASSNTRALRSDGKHKSQHPPLQTLQTEIGRPFRYEGASASDSDSPAALAPKLEQATSSSAFVTALEEQIERSKSHWSELVKPSESISIDEEVAAMRDNQEVFKTLQVHPTWGPFFRTFGYRLRERSAGSLEVGEKFAEGAQPELFHAHVKWSDPKYNEWDQEDGREWAVKVFNKGTLVQHLQLQWPHGLFKFRAEIAERTKLGKPLGKRYYCEVYCATLLEDGRFAFLMAREHEDLRSFIDRKTFESGNGCGPFPRKLAEEIMYRVALGMNWLHDQDIVHRDLKASNVLVKPSPQGQYVYCVVADFECSE